MTLIKIVLYYGNDALLYFAPVDVVTRLRLYKPPIPTFIAMKIAICFPFFKHKISENIIQNFYLKLIGLVVSETDLTILVWNPIIIIIAAVLLNCPDETSYYYGAQYFDNPGHLRESTSSVKEQKKNGRCDLNFVVI